MGDTRASRPTSIITIVVVVHYWEGGTLFDAVHRGGVGVRDVGGG